MSLRPTIDFLLHDWLGAEALNQRERFADHSRDTFDAVLDTCERIAREKFAPFNRLVDTQEPHFDGEKRASCRRSRTRRQKAYAESGMLSGRAGLRRGWHAVALRTSRWKPRPTPSSAMASRQRWAASAMLTSGNASLLMKPTAPTTQRERVRAQNQFNRPLVPAPCA